MLPSRRRIQRAVEHGIDEQLESEIRSALSLGHQSTNGGEIAPSAVTGDGQTRTIATEPPGVLRHPAQSRIAVFYRGRKRVFRCQAIFHRNTQAAGRVCQRAHALIVTVAVAQHPATAMEVDHHRQMLAGNRIEACWQGPSRSRYFEIKHPPDRLLGAVITLRTIDSDLTRLVQWHGGLVRIAGLFEPSQELDQLRMQTHVSLPCSRFRKSYRLRRRRARERGNG